MSKGRVITETERLIIREMTTDDAAFVLALINTPKFHRYIADRGVRTVEEAKPYIEERFLANYRQHGYSMYAVCLKDGTPIGNCGFVRRDTLPGPDIGFAFLPEYERQGYGFESSQALLRYGREGLGFTEVFAITSLDNDASVRLLEKLGFCFREIIASDDEQLKLFHMPLS
ncbi:MAG: GNAT family N-acetyltransferase [Chloracidobacterium sp.]|nr:GNAT family N-acetyltransferase [Chloracidobacterium sp.]